MLPGASHPTSLKEPGQEATNEIWMHLSQWKFCLGFQEPVFLQYLWRVTLHSDYTTFSCLESCKFALLTLGLKLFPVWLSPQSLQLQVAFSCGAFVSISTSAAKIKVIKICLFKQASGLGTIFVCVEMKHFISENCWFVQAKMETKRCV